jgi:hypothetical protein
MKFMSFNDWVLSKESSAFTRSRQAAALGLGPDIPDASMNSRSTASPWMLEGKKKKKKKKKKKRSEKSKKNS